MGSTNDASYIVIENLVVDYVSENKINDLGEVDYSDLADYVLENMSKLDSRYQEIFNDKTKGFIEEYSKKVCNRINEINSSGHGTDYFYFAKEIIGVVKEEKKLKTDGDKDWLSIFLASGGVFNYWLTYADWENYFYVEPDFLKNHLEQSNLVRLRGQGAKALADVNSEQTAKAVAENLKMILANLPDQVAEKVNASLEGKIVSSETFIDNEQIKSLEEDNELKSLDYNKFNLLKNDYESVESKLTEEKDKNKDLKLKIKDLEQRLADIKTTQTITVWGKPEKVSEGVYNMGGEFYIVQTSAIGGVSKAGIKKLTDLTVAELRALAKEGSGLKGTYKMKKSELLDALSQRWQC